MRHLAKVLTLTVAGLALTASFAMAQSAPAPSAAPSVPLTKVVDGPVKDVDPAAKTVKVGWLFGFLSTTLDVTDDTHIAIEGEKGSLDMIHEGDEAKVSYETRDGKNLAKTIEVTQPERESKPSKAASPAAASTRRVAESPSSESPNAP
jgi:hypothetical protein